MQSVPTIECSSAVKNLIGVSDESLSNQCVPLQFPLELYEMDLQVLQGMTQDSFIAMMKRYSTGFARYSHVHYSNKYVIWRCIVGCSLHVHPGQECLTYCNGSVYASYTVPLIASTSVLVMSLRPVTYKVLLDLHLTMAVRPHL